MAAQPSGEPRRRLRVVVADDHPVVRAGIRVSLTGIDVVILAEAGDGPAALAACHEHRPDILILDMYLPHLNGVDVTKQLARNLPHVKVVVFSMREDAWLVRDAFAAGAKGYVFKRQGAQELWQALVQVAAGGLYIDPALAKDGFAPGSNPFERPTAAALLSKRELQVLRMVARGLSGKEAAEELKLSARTLETYKVRAMQKLQLRSRVDLMRFATYSGWL